MSSQQEIERIVEEFKKKWNYQGAFQNAEAYPFVESWLRTTLTSLTEAHKGIKQGTLYGYDIVLMAPKEAIGDVINEHTLENYHKSEIEKARKFNIEVK